MDEKQTLQYVANNLQAVDVNSEVLTITPKVAEYLLNLNWIENRPLLDATVAKYAAAIKHGHWKLNGEPIIVANNGTMIDGQHRLYAVVEADKPIDALVTFGVDYDVVNTINCGRPRTMAFLSKMSPARAAALNFILRLGYGNSESTATNLVTMDQVYGEDVTVFTKMHNGGNMPILRQAPVIAAASMWHHAGETDYTVNVYRSLLNLDSGSLPPIGKAFLQQCAAASMGTRHKAVGSELFARAFKVFDPKQGLARKLMIKDVSVTVDQARTMIAKAMKHSGVTLDATPVVTKKPAKKVIKIKKSPNGTK